MNVNRFVRAFLALREALQTQNFSTKELHQLCLQGAIECEKLYLEETRLGLEEARGSLEGLQVKAKLELERATTRAQLEGAKAGMLNTLIQCHSMLKSLKDNAAINRANAYVSFLNVVGNATNGSGIAQHADNVIRTINKIGLDQSNAGLDGYLNQISQALGQLGNLESHGDYIEVFASSLETTPDYPVKIWGYSTLKDAKESFALDGRFFCAGNTMFFKEHVPKSYAVSFVSQNHHARLEKSLNLVVSPPLAPINP
ncbi:hypothetical protein [Helicobacter vulpis]|uniref:hypothetical protein n=1 Tax=Helicobacter vulpis TaxID=2316076 RepID=UPI000EB43D1E|nr:hypothetical protein [Helicobacter vulpis]